MVVQKTLEIFGETCKKKFTDITLSATNKTQKISSI